MMNRWALRYSVAIAAVAGLSEFAYSPARAGTYPPPPDAKSEASRPLVLPTAAPSYAVGSFVSSRGATGSVSGALLTDNALVASTTSKGA